MSLIVVQEYFIIIWMYKIAESNIMQKHLVFRKNDEIIIYRSNNNIK